MGVEFVVTHFEDALRESYDRANPVGREQCRDGLEPVGVSAVARFGGVKGDVGLSHSLADGGIGGSYPVSARIAHPPPRGAPTEGPGKR